MKPRSSEVSSTFNTQLPVVLLPSGNSWTKFGSTALPTSSESMPQNTESFWLKHHWTQKPIERRCAKSCSRPTMSKDFTLPSRPFFPFMPTEEPPVPSAMQVMVFPTLSQSSKVSRFPTLSERTWSLVEPLPTISTTFSHLTTSPLKEVSQPGNRSLEKSRRNFASSLLTQPPLRSKPPTPTNIKKTMNYPMVKLSLSTPQDSWAQKLSSSQILSSKEMKLKDSIRWHSHQSKSAILISERTFTETSSFPEVPPFMLDSQIDSRKKSMQCAHNQTWSRLSPQLTDITQYGSEDQLSAPSPLSKPNGSPRRNTKSQVTRSSIENAYEHRTATRWRGIQMLV